MTRVNQLGKIKRFGVLGTLALLGHAANYMGRKHLLRQSHMVRRIHGYRLWLDLRDPGLSRDVAIRGTREEQMQYLVERELRPGDVVLDIGANIGYYTMMMAGIVGDAGLVYAIEPEPRNYRLLGDNVRLNGMDGRVETFPLAASDRVGTARLFVSAYSNLNTLFPDSYDGMRTPGIADAAIETPMTDLSSFLEGKRPVDLLRMDIEGAEVEVLGGLAPAIETGLFSGRILFEVHRPKYNDDNHSMRKPLRWLFDHGYHARTLTSNDERRSRLRDRGYEPSRVVQTSDTRYMGVYDGVTDDDAIALLCDIGGVRDILLAKDPR